jgi:hypothetical protein
MSVNFYQTTQFNNPEDSHLHFNQCCFYQHSKAKKLLLKPNEVGLKTDEGETEDKRLPKYLLFTGHLSSASWYKDVSKSSSFLQSFIWILASFLSIFYLGILGIGLLSSQISFN